MNVTRTDPPAPAPTYHIELSEGEASAVSAWLSSPGFSPRPGNCVLALREQLHAALRTRPAQPVGTPRTVMVRSYSDSDTRYRVTIVAERAVACTCLDYQHRGGIHDMSCKHMRDLQAALDRGDAAVQ